MLSWVLRGVAQREGIRVCCCWCSKWSRNWISSTLARWDCPAPMQQSLCLSRCHTLSALCAEELPVANAVQIVSWAVFADQC